MSVLNRHCTATLFEEYFCGVMPEAEAAELTAHLVWKVLQEALSERVYWVAIHRPSPLDDQ